MWKVVKNSKWEKVKLLKIQIPRWQYLKNYLIISSQVWSSRRYNTIEIKITWSSGYIFQK